MGGFVDRLDVVRTVRGDRGHGISNLLKQGRDLCTVMRPVSGQIRRDDLTCSSFEAPGQSRMVGAREIDLEELCYATEEALGLEKRKVEDHADRQRGLDRDVRVSTLAARFAAGRSSPVTERSIRKPDSQVASAL